MREFTSELASNRELPKELLAFLRGLPSGLRPIDVLRLSIDYLASLIGRPRLGGPMKRLRQPG